MMTSGARAETDRVFTRPFVFTWIATFFHFGSFYILIPTLPLYLSGLGASAPEIGLVVGAFSGTSLFVRPIVGREADRRNRRGIMLVGALVFVACSLLYNVVASVPLLVLLRLVHGCGMACFVVAASALVADLAPAHRRAEVAGIYGMSTNTAMAIVPALGAFLVDVGGFTTVFLTAVAFTAVETALLLLVREPPRATQGNRAPGVFSRGALLPASVFAVYQFAYGAVLTFLPLYAGQIGVRNSGLVFFSVYAVVLVASRTFAGRLADRYGRVAVTAPGLLLSAAGILLLSLLPSEGGLMLAAAVYGLGFAAVQPTLMALTIDRVPPGERGSAMSFFTLGYDVGISVGSVLFGAILAASGFSTMFEVVALAPVAALVLLLLASRRRA